MSQPGSHATNGKSVMLASVPSLFSSFVFRTKDTGEIHVQDRGRAPTRCPSGPQDGLLSVRTASK
eukprot:10835721-Prorocentrum_lima.AAC.1